MWLQFVTMCNADYPYAVLQYPHSCASFLRLTVINETI